MRITLPLGLMLLLAAFSAQAQNPTPFDCQLTATFTATNLTSASYYNKGPAAPCIAWRLTYSTVNATAVSMSLQGTTNLANGQPDPAGWTNLTPTAPTVNPAVATSAGSIVACCDYYPWIRVTAGAFTGTNQTMSLSVLGYKGTSANRNTGGGGPCTLTGGQTTGFVLTATDNVSACQFQTPSAAVVNINTILAANYCGDTGSTNAIVCSTSTTFAAYATGQTIVVQKGFWTNTGATTIAVNGIIGTKSVTKNGATALASGNMVIGHEYALVYDGIAFQVLNPTLVAADIPSLSYQPPLTNYSTIAGLTGYPSTFPPPTATNAILGGVTMSTPTSSVAVATNDLRVTAPHGLLFSFDGGGAPLASGKTLYLRVPFACTIVNWSIMSTTAETVTVSLWMLSGGTAIPTVSNTINTSGVSLSAGTAVLSSTLTDFIQTAIPADAWLAATLDAVTASQSINYVAGCVQ